MTISNDQSSEPVADQTTSDAMSAGASERSIGEPTARQRWAYWLSWLFSLLLLFRGGQAVLNPPEEAPPGTAAAMIVAGLVIMPPVVVRLRRAIPFLRPVWTPPVVSCCVIAITAVTGIALTTPSKDGSGTPSTVALSSPLSEPLVNPPAAEEAAAKYVREVEAILLPVVEEPSGVGLYSEREMWGRLGDIEFWSRRIDEGRALNLNSEQKKTLARFEASLKAKQITEFPKLRAAYRNHAKETLWSKNVDVYGSGRMIEFVGGVFASRQNMLDALDPIREPLTRLRFTEARFRWIRNGEGARFPIESPGDGEIVVHRE